MTRPPTAAERLEAMNRAATLGQRLSTAPHTISHLFAAIELRIEDGIRAARYDGDGGSHGSGDGTSPTESTLLARQRHVEDCERDETCRCPDHFADRASGHYQQAEQAVWKILDAMRLLDALDREYQPQGAQLPGRDDCPSGWCRNHWAAGLRVKVAKGRYSERCRRCGDQHSKHGRDFPPAVLRAVEDAKAAGIREPWRDWRVVRAWASVA